MIAIGDIHGRADLLHELHAVIEADAAAFDFPVWTPAIAHGLVPGVGFLDAYACFHRVQRGPASA